MLLNIGFVLKKFYWEVDFPLGFAWACVVNLIMKNQLKALEGNDLVEVIYGM
jgi:hypothetical protein